MTTKTEWIKRADELARKADALTKEIKKLATETDYLICYIQDSDQTDNAQYRVVIDKAWIDAFHQELPLNKYSKARAE